MDVDYRKLCVDLFGTDDVKELGEIAREIKRKNPRNAGRKKKFTPEEVQTIRGLIENGMTMAEAAARFKTSRQVLAKYLNAKPAEGCTMRMTYMYKQRPCTVIDVNFMDETLAIQNKTGDVLHRAFGVIENPTWADFETFLRERCFPAARGNAKELLQELQLTAYDPLQIAEKTKGRTAEDDMWLKFSYYPVKGAAHERNQS